ncbi:MAG: carboxypeptidase-like regulatory domain-containing protein [Flavobacterium sp.]
MKKYFLLFLYPIAFVFSQNFIQIQGYAVSATDQKPLESATVYLQTKKDSSLVDYTSTDKNGKFSLKIKANQPPTVLKISYVGFKTYRKELNDYSKNIVLGNLLMEEISSELDEVVVKADVAPIKFKKDTLEFNASSFKVAPDANVMQLLKQLPGVEIDENGKITVNGKEVNNVLVNGKPLFGSDGKIAIQNLPAEIINKVQITTTKTKEEELAKEDASGNEATINLTIDEDKNKGLIGRITAGYGTNERYEASGLVNSFKGDRRFSVLASSNNINSTGFSMDEVFDNMNGGRNYNMWSNSDGSFGINDMQFGGNKGIVRTNMLGISYSDEWLKKKLSPIYTVLYNNNEIVNENQS